jgi:hypothetical protein
MAANNRRSPAAEIFPFIEIRAAHDDGALSEICLFQSQVYTPQF